MTDSHPSVDVEVTDSASVGSSVVGRAESVARHTLDELQVRQGHIAVEFVGEQRIQELNREHRSIDRPTDVLSFPVDALAVATGGSSSMDQCSELGDVVICPQHTEDIREAVVHGILHLCGYDHETDSGEMLKLQDQIVESLDTR